MSKVEISKHGNYLLGILDGVDFVASGKIDGNSYGASLKLKFITKVNVVKNLNGVDINTQKAVSQIIKIPTTDDLLPRLVEQYNQLIGKELLLKYASPDNQTYIVQDDVDVIDVNKSSK